MCLHVFEGKTKDISIINKICFMGPLQRAGHHPDKLMQVRFFPTEKLYCAFSPDTYLPLHEKRGGQTQCHNVSAARTLRNVSSKASWHEMLLC